ncbi:MAG: hypothetical protein ACLFVT_09250 [Syntrophobacteria bacterium]
MNMELLGALTYNGNIPAGRGVLETVLDTRTKKSSLEINRRAVELGFQLE